MRCAIASLSAGSISAAAGLLLCAGVASAQPARTLDVGSLAAFTDGQGSLRGPGNYATGFETVEGYVVGPIEPQNGWGASGVNLPAFNVNTANPFAGSQHLRVGFNSAAAAGAQQVVLGPNLGVIPAGVNSTSVQVNISSDGGADYDVVGQAPSQGFLSWRVKFHFQGAVAGSPGTIHVLDDIDLVTPGAQLGFVNTTTVWSEGAYTELRVDMDAGANTINYFYGNTLIYTSLAGVFAGTSVEQFVVVTDNFQEPNEVGDFDNVSIVPAPGALALLGLGLAGIARRRRA